MLPGIHDGLYNPGGSFSHRASPPNDPGWCPFQIALVAFGHMLFLSGMAALPVISFMTGYPVAPMEDFQGCACVPHIYFFLH